MYSLWDVVSKNHPGYGSGTLQDTSKPANDIRRLFGVVFTGRDPVTGLTRQELQRRGITKFGELERRYPGRVQNKPAPKPAPKKNVQVKPQPAPTKKPEQFAQNLDSLLIRAHNLDPKRFQNETNWMLNFAKQKLKGLPENKRRLIADPNVTDAQKVVLLREWTRPKTLDEVETEANQRRLDLRERPYRNWQEYQADLKRINANDTSQIYGKYWTPEWDKNQRRYGTGPSKGEYYNPAWGPPETTPWAIPQIQRQAKVGPIESHGVDLGQKYQNWTPQDYENQRRQEVSGRRPFTLGGYLANIQGGSVPRQTTGTGVSGRFTPGVIERNPPPPERRPSAVIEQTPPPPIYGGSTQSINLPQSTTPPPTMGGSSGGYNLEGLMSNITNALGGITNELQNKPYTPEQERFNKVLDYIEHSISNAQAPGDTLYNPLKEKWRRQTNRTLRQAIKALANRGILQSSTAGRILGDVAGQSRDAYANLLGYIANLNEGARRFNLGTGLSMANSLLGLAGLKEGSRKTNLSSLLGAGNIGLGVMGAIPAYLRGMYSLENIDPWKAGLAQEAYYNAFAQNELPANWQPNTTGGNTVNGTNGMYSGGFQNNPYAGGSGDFWNSVALAGLLGAF